MGKLQKINDEISMIFKSFGTKNIEYTIKTTMENIALTLKGFPDNEENPELLKEYFESIYIEHSDKKVELNEDVYWIDKMFGQGKGNFIPYLSSIINGTKIIGTKENDESFWTSLKFDDKSKKDECWKVNEGLRGKYNTNFGRYNVIYDDNNDDNKEERIFYEQKNKE